MQSRYRRGLTQKQLAAQVEIPQSTISGAESGLGNPSLLLIYQLARFYKISIDDLMEPAPEEFVMGKKADLIERELASGSRVHEMRSSDQTIHYKKIKIPAKGSVRIPAGPTDSKEILVCHSGDLWVKSKSDCRFVKAGQALEILAHLPKIIYGSENLPSSLTLFRVKV